MEKISAEGLLSYILEHRETYKDDKTQVNQFEVTGKLRIEFDKFYNPAQEFGFIECIFHDDVEIINSWEGSCRISITACKFLGAFTAITLGTQVELTLRSSTFSKDVTVQEELFVLYMKDVTLEQDLNLTARMNIVKLDKVVMNGAKSQIVYPGETTTQDFSIVKSTLNVVFLTSVRFKNLFLIHDCKIKKLTCNNIAFENECELVLSYIELLEFNHVDCFTRFRALGLGKYSEDKCSIKFRRVRFHNKASFDGSLLGDTDFTDCEFIGYASFKDVRADKLRLYRTDFEKSADFIGLDVKSDVDRHTARIIKHEFMKTNNNVEALRYKEIEMRAYERELGAGNQFFDAFILWMNKWSNKFGTSWTRGVRFVVIVSWLGYILYTITLPIKPYTFQWTNMDSFIRGTDKTLTFYLQFLDITHKSDFIKDYHPNSLSYLVDFLTKIFIGYGIFQTVAAFRKFGKGE